MLIFKIIYFFCFIKYYLLFSYILSYKKQNMYLLNFQNDYLILLKINYEDIIFTYKTIK